MLKHLALQALKVYSLVNTFMGLQELRSVQVLILVLGRFLILILFFFISTVFAQKGSATL